jgi:hypothetical protein
VFTIHAGKNCCLSRFRNPISGQSSSPADLSTQLSPSHCHAFIFDQVILPFL